MYNLRITIITITLFLVVSSLGQSINDPVVLFMKNGSMIHGKLVRLTFEKTIIDPENNLSLMTLSNVDIEKLGFVESDRIIKYPVGDTILTKAVSKNYSKKTNRSFFSFGIIGGRSSSITTSAFDGFENTKILPAFVIGGAARFFICQLVEFEALVTYTQLKITENSDDLGSLTFIPIVFNYKMQIIPRKKSGVGFHVDLGAGVALTKFQKGPAISEIEKQEGVTITVETNKPFVLNLGIGLDVFIIRQLAIGCDFRLLTGNVSTVWKFNGVAVEFSDKIYASSFIMGLNLRYCLR